MPTTSLKGLGDELMGFVKRLPAAEQQILSEATVKVAGKVQEVAPVVSGQYVASEGVSGAGGKALTGGFAPLTSPAVSSVVGQGTRVEVGNAAGHAPFVEQRHAPHAAGVAALEGEKTAITGGAFEVAKGARR